MPTRMQIHKNTRTQEVKKYVVDLVEEGYSDGLIKNLVKEKFNLRILDDEINRYFRESRNAFMNFAEYNAEKKITEAANFNEKVQSIKQNAKPGYILIYIGNIEQQDAKPKVGEKQAVIKAVYRHFILTDDGCIQFNDIKGVIRIG